MYGCLWSVIALHEIPCMFRSSLANEGWHLHKCGKLHALLPLIYMYMYITVEVKVVTLTILADEEGPVDHTELHVHCLRCGPTIMTTHQLALNWLLDAKSCLKYLYTATMAETNPLKVWLSHTLVSTCIPGSSMGNLFIYYVF